MANIKIAIADDYKVYREGLKVGLSTDEDFQIILEAENGRDLLNALKAVTPDVILMDIDMPGGINGIDAVQKIRAFNQDVQIIMLTVFDDNKTVLEAIASGASGYLLKKNISEKLYDAIKEVLSGGAPMSPNVARMVIASMHKKRQGDENIYQLTPREKEILVALSEGVSYKAMASQFYISLDTVRSHIKNIYQKMQVHNQLEAVARARSSGIVN